MKFLKLELKGNIILKGLIHTEITVNFVWKFMEPDLKLTRGKTYIVTKASAKN
jgi:hypothetical protein